MLYGIYLLHQIGCGTGIMLGKFLESAECHAL